MFCLVFVNCYNVGFSFDFQIKREISTMKLIKHPNVLKLFEVPMNLILFKYFWHL